jgi:hypothetical protein
VYKGLLAKAWPSSQPGRRSGAVCRLLALVSVLVALPLLPAARAGVLFENCVTAADGSITCDTVPTGDTLMDAEAARDGLLQNASPGWSEFDPYEGFDDEFGGNQT